jgi:hypothetical protein
MTKSIGGDEAKRFADAHEAGSQSADETAMDLHNNRVGRQLGAGGGDCGAKCRAALDSGRLRVLRSTGSGPVPPSTPLQPSGGVGVAPPADPSDPTGYPPGDGYY